MRASLFFASACVAILSPAYGQLYLIQASPTPRSSEGYPTTLLQVAADGAVRAVSQILPGGPAGGSEWTGMSFDHRKAVLLPKPPSHTIVVLDFDTASVVKGCEAPPPPTGMGSLPLEEWLADIPGKGLVYVEDYGTADLKKLVSGHLTGYDYALRGMLADASTPCDQSFVAASPNDVKFLVANGQAGVAGLASGDGMNIGIDEDGSARRVWIGGERTYFGYRVPKDLTGDLVRPITSIAIDNSQALGIIATDPMTGRWHLLMLLKNDNTWHSVPRLSDRVGFVRGFGSFVAIAETQPRTAQNSESAGRAEWRKTETAAGPSIEAILKELPYVLPGKLDLYDAATEKMYNIVTNQGDSEILLVDDNTVYYRVSDRLYSAAIGKEGLEPARLISTSESIRDVHWAFVKH